MNHCKRLENGENLTYTQLHPGITEKITSEFCNMDRNYKAFRAHAISVDPDKWEVWLMNLSMSNLSNVSFGDVDFPTSGKRDKDGDKSLVALVAYGMMLITLA
jgi:hypothetical protein